MKPIQTDPEVPCPRVQCNNAGTIAEACYVCDTEPRPAKCRSCRGTGTIRWCPKCGSDYYEALDAAKRVTTSGGMRS